MLWAIILFGMVFLLCPHTAQSQNEKKVTKAIRWLRTACVSGEKIEVQIKGDGGISLRKKSVSGELSFVKKEVHGFIDSLGDEIKAEQANKIRACMEPYIKRILDIILGSEAKNTEKESCVLFEKPLEHTKQRVLAEARRLAFSEFYGELADEEKLAEDPIVDYSSVTLTLANTIRLQGNPKYYNSNENLGEVCVKAKFFIIQQDIEQMQPQLVRLKNYCLPFIKLLQSSDLEDEFRYSVVKERLSRINPKVEGMRDEDLMQLVRNFQMGALSTDASHKNLCADVSFKYLPILVRSIKDVPKIEKTVKIPDKSVKSLGSELRERGREKRRFIKYNNGTVLDKKTELIWMAKDFHNIRGRGSRDWSEAMAWVKKIKQRRYGDYDNWRVPTIREYKTIYDPRKMKRSYRGKAIGYPQAFDDSGGEWFWSSEEIAHPYSNRFTFARIINFESGSVNEELKNRPGNSLRLVRGGQ